MSSATDISRQAVLLDIFGQRLRLHANAEPEHLERLAAMVNERCEQMRLATRSNVPGTVLALVCIDLADALQSTRRELEELRTRGESAALAAETRAREIESMARQAVVEAIQEIDRLLANDASDAASSGESETA